MLSSGCSSLSRVIEAVEGWVLVTWRSLKDFDVIGKLNCGLVKKFPVEASKKDVFVF